MKKRFVISISILFLLTGKAVPQQDSIVWISGNVIDSGTSAPVPYANIASYTRHIIFAADSLGHFYIQLPRHDSIKIIVLGYDMKVFKLDSMITDDEEEVTFRINRGSIMLKNVDIKLKRSYFDSIGMANRKNLMENLHLPGDIIPYDKSKDVIPASYKPVFKHKPPPLAFFFHPVSYISYFTSKQEKSKRNMVILVKSARKDTLMYRDLIKEVTGFTGEALNKFVIYCNKNLKIGPKDDVYEIRRKIFLIFDEYLREEH